MNHYDVLRINQNASADEINRAFRILAKKYHPDLNKKPGAKENFLNIHEAYSVLFVTGTGIGCGKQNTEQIITALNKKYFEIKSFPIGYAAQLCGEYVLNGFKDWFLPSKDELNELYKSIKQYDLSGFSNAEFWSSSSTKEKTDDKHVWCQSFKDGTQLEQSSDCKKSVRAVRYF